MPQQTFASIMRRLSAAGFKRRFARVAVLPDWWDPSCASDPRLLPEIEIRVARFVGAPLAIVRDPSIALAAPAYAGAQLRRVRDIDRDRLSPAIHAALRVAAAVVRSASLGPVEVPARDPLTWRAELAPQGGAVRLADVLGNLWDRGIPVIHMDLIPAPSFQGLACIVEGRPVIVIGHDVDEPARLAFIVSHEVAHIANGDCAPGQPVVDEQEEISDGHEIERRADEYATWVLTGGTDIPHLSAPGFKELARSAADVEKHLGIDAAAVVWSWARKTGDYATATMALRALYRTKGGNRLIRDLVRKHVDFSAASESDRALLLCLGGDRTRDAAVD